VQEDIHQVEGGQRDYSDEGKNGKRKSDANIPVIQLRKFGREAKHRISFWEPFDESDESPEGCEYTFRSRRTRGKIAAGYS